MNRVKSTFVYEEINELKTKQKQANKQKHNIVFVLFPQHHRKREKNTQEGRRVARKERKEWINGQTLKIKK